MEKQISRFRGQVEAHFGGRAGPGSRYSEALKAQAVEIVLEKLAREGGSFCSVADELGVSVGALRRWVEAAPPRAGQLRAVEVERAEEEWSDESVSGKGLALVTSAGHRVEGLALSEVALLLESLA